MKNKRLILGRLPAKAYEKDLTEVLEPYAKKHYKRLLAEKAQLEKEMFLHPISCRCVLCFKK